jgi:hypothetical protein
MANKAHVTFGFYKGVELADPEDLLEGTGKGMRHVKVRAKEDIRKAQFTKWVREAMKVNEGNE